MLEALAKQKQLYHEHLLSLIGKDVAIQTITAVAKLDASLPSMNTQRTASYRR